MTRYPCLRMFSLFIIIFFHPLIFHPQSESLTRFHSRTPPSISILDYLRRIVRYANVEVSHVLVNHHFTLPNNPLLQKTCLLITLHYIDQVCARIPKFFLSSLTCHRFVIAAIVVSSKALCDAFCTNNHYAKVGGIRVGELNVLEKEFLSMIDWRLTVSTLLFPSNPLLLCVYAQHANMSKKR